MTQPMSVLTSHASVEWYTPPQIIDLVREVLTEIDLDPASDPTPQKWIKANRIYNKDGLDLEWSARTVFCNPPYGKINGIGSNQGAWSSKMHIEYTYGNFGQGILLINSTHGYSWYEWITREHPVCQWRDRIRFIKPDGTAGGQAKRGQTFVYFGADPSRFIEVFGVESFGRILLP